jgi:hypothetical protein
MRRHATRARVMPVLGLMLLVHLASPADTRAAGTCAITVEPDTLRVGQTFVIKATGFEPNEVAIGFAALDSGGSAALGIQLDSNGSLTRTVTAETFMVGTHSVSLTGDLSNCGASADLTVLPASGAPGTDTVPRSPSAQTGSPGGILAVLSLAAFVATLAYLRRRSTSR